MKKFASVLTVTMLVMSMLLCCISANAATSTAIDAEKKGSVTLYKYNSQTSETAENSVTSGDPVSGAGFSFYQILTYDSDGYKLTDLAKNAILANDSTADLDEVIDSIIIKNGNADTDGDDSYATYGSTNELEALVATFQAYINGNNVTPEKTIITGDNGSATASELPLGIYLVSETTVPDGYIATTASFVVSVPYWESNTVGWNYDVVAYPKDEPYGGTVKKEIVTDSNNTDTDSLAIGDTVTYEVSGIVPNYGKSYSDTSVNLTQDRTIITQEVYDVLPFVFTDTLSSGLTYADNLSIKVAGSPEVTLTQDTTATYNDTTGKVTWGSGDYYVSFDSDSNTLKVIVKWDSIDSYQGNAITFSYDAVIDADAVVTDGNGNEATISVANNPSTFDGDYSNITTDEYTSSTDTSTVYTYQLNLTKTFNGKTASDADVNATAVTFEIAEGTAENSAVYSFLKTGDGKYTLWTGAKVTENGKEYAVVYTLNENGNITTDTAYVTGAKESSELTNTVAVGADGTLSIKGLDNKTYYVTEITTVSGYSVLAQSVPVEVSDVTTTTTTTTYHPFVAYGVDEFTSGVTYYTKNGEQYVEITDLSTYVSTTDNIKVVYYSTTETVTGNASSDVTAEVTGGQTLKAESPDNESGVIPMTVNNSKNQFNLPLTGGIGLWIFTIGGGVIMAVAIIIFSVLRKKKSEE